MLGSPAGLLSEGHVGKALGDGETVGHRVLEKWYRGLPVLATLQAVAAATPWPEGPLSG